MGQDVATSGTRQRKYGRLARLPGRVPQARRCTIQTAAGEARYLVAGEGPPVVLLHGLEGSSRWWAPTIGALRSHYRCYALEFVHFARWRERGRVPLAQAGAFVAAWLDALGLAPVQLLAHSMGGYTAVALALARPELVARLVLIAPAGLVRPLLTPRASAKTLGFLGTVAPAFAPVLALDAARTGPHRWLRSLHELFTAAPLDLGALRAPTLLLWGTRDPLVPPAQGRLLQQRIPGARLLYLPGARHVPMYERPALCNDAIARFLAGDVVGTV